VPHRNFSEVTQPKHLSACFDRERASGPVNSSILVEDVTSGRNALRGYNRPARPSQKAESVIELVKSLENAPDMSRLTAALAG
jgi:hypothetical protein